jgi:hypothetical protein
MAKRGAGEREVWFSPKISDENKKRNLQSQEEQARRLDGWPKIGLCMLGPTS